MGFLLGSAEIHIELFPVVDIPHKIFYIEEPIQQPNSNSLRRVRNLIEQRCPYSNPTSYSKECPRFPWGPGDTNPEEERIRKSLTANHDINSTFELLRDLRTYQPRIHTATFQTILLQSNDSKDEL